MKSFVASLSAILILIGISSCNEPVGVGTDLVDEDQYLNTIEVDTFSINAHLYQLNSVITAPAIRVFSSGAIDSREYILGASNDPVFGPSRASLFTQFRLPGGSIELQGTDLELDSIVLALRYNASDEAYGDTLATTNIKVYEVDHASFDSEGIKANTTYYSTAEVITSELLGEINDVIFAPKDSATLLFGSLEDEELVYNTVRTAPQLRISLNNDFGTRLLSLSGQTEFESNENFQAYFNGISIEVDPSANSYATFEPVSVFSNLELYYHSATEIGKLITFPVNVDNEAAAINRFETDYSGTPLEQVLVNDFPNSQDLIYLQAMAGTGLEIDFPYIADIPPVVINLAKLVLTVVPEFIGDYEPPETIAFRTFDPAEESDSIRNIVVAQKIINEDELDEFGDPLIQYSLSLSFHMQESLEGEYDSVQRRLLVSTDEYLTSNLVDDAITPARVVFGGPEHPDYPMKLKMYLTPVE